MLATAVYSGSFNPLHKGHLAVVRHLVEVLGFERVRLIVSPHNPLKENADPASARRRYEAALEAASRVSELPIVVDDIELTLPSPQYTIRTLDMLRELHPDENHILAIGADNLDNFRHWRDYARILTDYGVVVFPRQGSDVHAAAASLLAENPRYRITVADFELVNISSTAIRNGQTSENQKW